MPAPSLDFAPEMGEAASLPQSLQRILAEFVQRLPCDAAYLAIRQGDRFRVEAVWGEIFEGDGPFAEVVQTGQTIPLTPAHLLEMIIDTGLGQITVEPDEINTLAPGDAHADAHIPARTFAPPFQACLAVPLRIGQRVIGLTVFLASQPQTFPVDTLPHAHDLARHAAPLVENAVTLAEAERHLQRLALLNELAAAASLSSDVESVARRVLRLLRRTFQTSRVGLFLLSPDNQLQSYGEDRRLSRRHSLLLDTSLGERVLEAGVPLRLPHENGAHTAHPPTHHRATSLLVPLKYRGTPVGVLGLETDAPHDFSVQDEQLLLVIASHLAGLIENVHLNEETRGRARNLTAIHHIVQQIVGLVDAAEIAQATAALTAGQFEYALVLILLMGETGHALTVEGVGGKLAGFLTPKEPYPLPAGDATPDPLSWLARAGVPLEEDMRPLSIPLQAGEQTLGLFLVVRAALFTENDRLVLESLAGVLSSVLLNARRYKQLQERIEAQNRTEKQMVEATRLAAVGEIAAGVAHELNNPLTTIAGFTELVLDDLPADARAREDLELVLQEARRAREVVRRLLDFSREDESLRAPADINEILGEALALVHHLARVNGVEIQYVPWDALPLIRMDRGQIKQVILNLVQNALHAMPRGGTLVLQTTLETRDDRKWATLRVLDTGHGIPPEIMSKVFDPFFTTKPPGQGTGLGLSISNHIVADHGGTMEVESQPGQGTCFTVWLPVETG